MTEDHKKKIGLSNSISIKKLWQNHEYKKRMSEAHKGQIPIGLAKCHTPEAIEKMRQTKLKQYANPKNHPRFINGKSHTPEMRVIYENRRRALKYASKNRLSLQEWKIIKAEYHYKCACCKKRVKLTIDHIVPLSRNGSDGKENIQPLCMICNQKKFLSDIRFTKDA